MMCNGLLEKYKSDEKKASSIFDGHEEATDLTRKTIIYRYYVIGHLMSP